MKMSGFNDQHVELDYFQKVGSLKQIARRNACVNKERSNKYRIGGVMVSVLASSAVDREFEFRSGQTKDYKINICCFTTNHAAFRLKSKDWLCSESANVSEWGDMFNHGLLFLRASTTIKLSVLVWHKADLIIISFKINLLTP